jgi:hypothetical protein
MRIRAYFVRCAILCIAGTDGGVSHQIADGAVMDQTSGIQALEVLRGFPAQSGRYCISGDEGTRYSDEQLYALALYISSPKAD